jgi:hypothetical protein
VGCSDGAAVVGVDIASKQAHCFDPDSAADSGWALASSRVAQDCVSRRERNDEAPGPPVIRGAPRASRVKDSG